MRGIDVLRNDACSYVMSGSARCVLLGVIVFALLIGGCCSVKPAMVFHPAVEPLRSGVRSVFVPGAGNARDLGGWRTQDGRRVRQGMIYRSSAFDRRRRWYTFGRRATVSAESAEFWRRELGVKTDLDLRADHEVEGMTISPLGADVEWIRIPMVAYGGINSSAGRRGFKAIFQLLLDSRRYPVVFHCQFGRDRAGTVAYLLNALLGVPKASLDADWELSLAWCSSKRYTLEKCVGSIDAALAEFPGESVNEKVEAYVLSLGFTTEDVARFRQIMTEADMWNDGKQRPASALRVNIHGDDLEQAIGKTDVVPQDELAVLVFQNSENPEDDGSVKTRVF